MRPFTVSAEGKQLTQTYPAAAQLHAILEALPSDELSGFLRLWITEGIPSAFSGLPLLYEKARNWMAMKLQVHPKDITIVGSGRLGYSLAPHPEFGRPFSSRSDLDFNIMSQSLFTQMIADFEHWKRDVEAKAVMPRNGNEGHYWAKNLELLPGNIRRGFLDSHKLPNLLRYPTAAVLANVRWQLSAKLSFDAISNKISIRVFRSWDAFLNQACMNFVAAIKSHPRPNSP